MRGKLYDISLGCETSFSYESIHNCPGKHRLNKFETEDGDYVCSRCKRGLRMNEIAYGCRDCDWDLCEKCNVTSQTILLF